MRARLAVAGTLATVLAVPPIATAHPTDCGTPGKPVCPGFNASVEVGTSGKYVNLTSSLTFRLNQPDGAMPILGVTHMIPRGWRFSVGSVRPALRTDGSPAQACNEIYSNLGNHRNNKAATLGSAENLGFGGVVADTDGTREKGPRNQTPRPTKFGTYPGKSAGGGGPGSVPFIAWNPDTETASMCMYLYSKDYRLDYAADPTDACNLRGSGYEQVDTAVKDPNCEAAREHLVDVTLQKIKEPDPDAASFGWKIDYDLSSFYRNAFLFGQHFSPLAHELVIGGLSAGNWNEAEAGVRSPVTFSRTPSQPGSYPFETRLTACEDGMASPPAADVCRAGKRRTHAVLRTVDIDLPPSSSIRDFARISGPTGPSGMPSTYALIRGTSSMKVTWKQPPPNPLLAVKGYVLVVANPGDQDSRHFEYLVTNPAVAGYDKRALCNEDGRAETCSLTLNFPLPGLSKPLDGDGFYDLALVTLYTDGTRTDGRCDDGSGIGAACPDFKVVAPGVSIWHVLMRSDKWPNAYVETQSFRASGGGFRRAAPAFMLMVDFELQRAEFILWRANPKCNSDPTALGLIPEGLVCLPALRPEVYASGNTRTIAGRLDAGVVSFTSASGPSDSPAIRFDGVVFPAGLGPVWVDPNTLVVSQPEARGVFTFYDTKGRLPNPPNGLPGGMGEMFEGRRLP